MKNRSISILLLLCLCLSLVPAYAADLSIETEETLIDGVTYRHIQKLSDNGWQDIYVVRADLNEPHLKFDVLSSQSGKSFLENTLASAQNAGAIAAINADFFSKGSESGTGSPIGLQIKDGVLQSSPAAYEKMNALYQLKDSGKLFFDMFNYSFTVTAPDGTSAPITVINKFDSMAAGIVLYTSDWGATTPGSSGNVLEVVVEDGKVTAKNRDVGPVAIPEKGYVLACDLSMHTFLDDHLGIGFGVEIAISTTPDYETIETAVGGGGMILVEGQVPSSFSHTVSGVHPRSAVGIDKSGKIITLVVVDGRRSGAAGMSMSQLGALMKELGCHNAMNLDGGGSSLMAIQKNGSPQVANQPSDNYKRPVSNSIGITAEPYAPVLADLRITSDDKAVFAGTSTWLKVELLDQYGAFMETAEPEDVIFETDNGSVKNGFYFGGAAGKASITASYGGKTARLSLDVLGTPHRLSFSTIEQKLSSGAKRTLWMTAWDKDGKSAMVYPADVTISVENPAIASVTGNTLTAHTKGSTVVKATFGSTTAHTVIAVDGAEAVSAPKNVSLPDPQQFPTSVQDGGFQFTVFGNTRTQKVLFDIYLNNGAKNAMRRDSQMNFFVGNEVDPELLTDLGEGAILASGYREWTENGSTFITLKNAYGATLYGSDSSQLQKLKAAVDGLAGGNLFVFLNDHNISYFDTELKVFQNLMAEAAKKADNVYVFGGGFVNETEIKDGVRYITTAGIFPSIGFKPPATNISYVKYYLVTVNGDKVTYETKGIMK